jgi:uncharacterized membrane protein
MNSFSIKESISFGWTTFKSRPWLFVGVGVLVFAISFLAQLPSKMTDDLSGLNGALLGILAFVISTGVSLVLDMGKTAFYLRAHDSAEHATVRDLWHPHPFWKFVGASVLAGLATLIGLILLIVPGIIIAIMVAFSTYAVIDLELGPIEAIKHSARLTKGHRWHLFRFGLVLLGLNLLGFIVLIVGLIVTIPISILAVVHVYRKLSESLLPAEVQPA